MEKRLLAVLAEHRHDQSFLRKLEKAEQGNTEATQAANHLRFQNNKPAMAGSVCFSKLKI